MTPATSDGQDRASTSRRSASGQLGSERRGRAAARLGARAIPRLRPALAGAICLLGATYLWQSAEDAATVASVRESLASEAPRMAARGVRDVPSGHPVESAAALLEARALATLERDDRALEAYRRAARLQPASWVIPYETAIVLARAGDRAAARAQMARALALNPRLQLPPGFLRPGDPVPPAASQIPSQ